MSTDPLHYEKAQAERLAGILRERYSTPGPWQFTGGQPEAVHAGDAVANVFGLGWFYLNRPRERDLPYTPPDVRAVSNLCMALYLCSISDSVEMALRHGKSVVALLHEAQAQCDEIRDPVILSDPNFTEQRQEILRAMYECGKQGPVKAGDILTCMYDPPDSRQFQRQMEWIREAGLVESQGKAGLTKHVLTPLGLLVGARLCVA